MVYEDILPAIFLSRPNRFIAQVEIDGKKEICHVKNTGRCRELLLPGAGVYVQKAAKAKRKTQYDLIAVEKGERLINMDSQVPNKVFAEWLGKSRYSQDITNLKPEAVYGASRFDFYLEAGERKIYVEVKGVTLEEDGVALFPDAPTERGVKHIRELCRCLDEGYEGVIVFIIQMKGVRYFTPNDAMHPAFGAALREAEQAGVEIMALDCLVTDDGIVADEFVKVVL